MPREDIKVTKVYTFDELSDKAKEKARDEWREDHLNYDWYDGVYGMADEVFKIIGLTSDKMTKRMDGTIQRSGPCIWFSGFSSQGDGACFEGTYSYAKGARKAIRKEYPSETELHDIVDELQMLQSRYLYRIEARSRHTGRYYHSGCVQIEVTRNGYEDLPPDVEADVAGCLRSLMDWIYKKLEQEHDYLLSDECIDESIACSEVEFTEDGSVY